MRSSSIISYWCLVAMMAVAGSLLLETQVFAKDYTRSCKASIGVKVTSLNSNWTRAYHFKGKGTVGYYAPNKARERARKNIDECVDAHWARRTENSRPRQCTETNKIYDYELRNMMQTIRDDMCLAYTSIQLMTVQVDLRYHPSNSGSGCAPRNRTRILARNVRISCPDLTLTGSNTDRPGSDIRSVDLARRDVNACRAECDREPRCRSWTYEKRRGKCWLKHSIPRSRPDDCCISGIKH